MDGVGWGLRRYRHVTCTFRQPRRLVHEGQGCRAGASQGSRARTALLNGTYASRCAHCGAEVRGWECEHGKKGFVDAGTNPGVEHVCAVVARRERFNPLDEPLLEAKCPDCGEKIKVRHRLGIPWHLDRETLRVHACRGATA